MVDAPRFQEMPMPSVSVAHLFPAASSLLAAALAAAVCRRRHRARRFRGQRPGSKICTALALPSPTAGTSLPAILAGTEVAVVPVVEVFEDVEDVVEDVDIGAKVAVDCALRALKDLDAEAATKGGLCGGGAKGTPDSTPSSWRPSLSANAAAAAVVTVGLPPGTPASAAARRAAASSPPLCLCSGLPELAVQALAKMLGRPPRTVGGSAGGIVARRRRR